MLCLVLCEVFFFLWKEKWHFVINFTGVGFQYWCTHFLWFVSGGSWECLLVGLRLRLLYDQKEGLGKLKAIFTLVQALMLCTGRTAHRGSRGIDLPFHDHGTRRGWGFSVTPRPLFTPGKTRYPLYRRLGGPQGRYGKVRKIAPPPGFDSRTVQLVASRYNYYATRPTRKPSTAPVSTQPISSCVLRIKSRVKNWIFVVPCIMLYSSEISPTRCNNCVCLPVAIYSVCTPDDGWDCRPKYVE